MTMEKYGVDQEAIEALVEAGVAPEEARVAAAKGPEMVKEAMAGAPRKQPVRNRFTDILDEVVEESSGD